MMSEAKHTPGPWSMRASRDGSGDIGITALGVGNVIAECFSAMRSRDERAIDEAAANARLIAAAPELLEALRDTLRMLEAAHRQLGMHSADNPRVVKARAALAKATGAQE